MQSLTINHLAIKIPSVFWGGIVVNLKKINRLHIGCFLLCYCALQLAFSFGQALQQEFTVERNLLAVENRISLDLPRLSLPNPALNMAGNPAQVSDYLDRLNRVLSKQNNPVRVIRLQDFNVQDLAASEQLDANGQSHAHLQIVRDLYLPAQTIHLIMGVCQPPLWKGLSLYPLLTAGLLMIFFAPFLQLKTAEEKRDDAEAKTPELVIDLENKCLRYGAENEFVFLANKPLCFYAALLTYCQQHPGAKLCQHSSLPDELLALANQYFLRLIALGHTIRKRPDFDMNLEKMLSEIRAALDELLIQHPESKALFYPPKALGEGSRSKLHNFALLGIRNAHWSIKGK
ncbi:hypothetical protein [Cellvibrio sp. NN19]|uniref:hypothetical protein n=1 Tax=Cellvibrio chitinivorans TaxID=3102792 RepID=UPI002B414123|nr:hypothetical protein [Cellvibrio sp. NN19]